MTTTAVSTSPTSSATPVPVARPDVWSMPDTGAEWCDCGQHHPVDRDLVHRMVLRSLGATPERIEHTEICRVLMDMWCYVEVCEFFHDSVCRASEQINGEISFDYPLAVGEEIIAYFSKTWNGCPVEACAGGFDEVGPDR
ncbi:hypothetical protein [uncultured Corynebacterium sp.]|uniref:hypothetical protein n=1 Tax=uncultured Corynebacterium sp. TaxID=159447 RepID=UPI0025FBDD49|nr:hypothetical protein [uncultured Corynebacterium sp.]